MATKTRVRLYRVLHSMVGILREGSISDYVTQGELVKETQIAGADEIERLIELGAIEQVAGEFAASSSDERLD